MPEDQLFGGVNVPRQVLPDQSVGAFVKLAYVTAREGPNSTSRITGVGRTDDHETITVSDLDTCHLYLFDIRNAARIRTFGRCGEGPAEFRYAGDADVWGNRYFVQDPALHHLIILDRSGVERERINYRDLVGSSSLMVTALAPVARDTFLVLVASAGPINATAAGVDWRKPLLLVASDGSGSADVSPANLRVPRALVQRVERGHYTASYHFCVQPGFELHKHGHVVLAQQYGFESTVLDANLRTTADVVSTAPAAAADTLAQFLFGNGLTRMYLACGSMYYALGARIFAGRDERTQDIWGRIEVHHYDGTLVAAADWTTTNRDSYVGSPRVVLGDTLVTVTNDDQGYERVELWRVR